MEPTPASLATPLWTRVERDRGRLALLVIEVCVAIALCAAAFSLVVVFVAALFGAPAPSAAGWDAVNMAVVVGWVTWVVFLLALAWTLWTLARADRTVLARLGAVRVPTGELPELKRVLKDMGLAAGYTPAPEPWLLPFDSINACAVAATRKRPFVAFTRGFVTKLDPDQQRAVFANLLARLASGDVEWGTGAFALMAPVFAMRDRDLSGENDALFTPAAPSEEDGEVGFWSLEAAGPDARDEVGLLLGLVLYVPLVAVTELMASAFESGALAVAEAADARGMLLLKDPQDMLGTLGKVLPADNAIPVSGSALGILFYAWPGWNAPIGEEDPELRRVSRLRQVLGAEGHSAADPG